MSTKIILTQGEGGITMHFEGEVEFSVGSEQHINLPSPLVDIVAFSNEFEKEKVIALPEKSG